MYVRRKKDNVAYRLTKKLTVSFLSMALVFSSMAPLSVSAETTKIEPLLKNTSVGKISDNSSLDDYKDLFPESSLSTQNTGRVWSDKTVFSENSQLNDGKGNIALEINQETGEDFNVVFSTISSSKEVYGKSEVALDVSFILDTSGSMADNGKLDSALSALNSSVETLMDMNPYNRVSLTMFSKSAEIIFPLDRYTDFDNRGYFGKVIPEPSDPDIFYRGAYAKNSQGNTIEKAISAIGGTNTQLGYAIGMKVLEDVKDTTVEINGRVTKRVPVVVMLSDGQPTYSINNEKWWESTSTRYQGPGDESYAGNGILAMMTAAYRKESINRNYEIDNVSLYTIGFETENLENAEDKALAAITLNPSAYWDSVEHDFYKEIRESWDHYVNNATTNIKINSNIISIVELIIKTNYELTHPNANDISGDMLKNYVDRYYPANNVQELNDAFKRIIEEISLNVPEYPTKIESQKNPLNSGYVTYIDPIGEYMEVKQVKSVIYDGVAFPVTNNQDGTYSAVGTITHPVYGKVDLTNVKIETSIDEAEKQTLIIKVPAAAIPLVIDVIELDGNEEVATHTQTTATPIRVVYSVGLKKGIDRTTLQGVSDQYIAKNTNNGLVNFYSNRYTKGNQYGDATVSFEPSISNPNYHVQNEQVLLDESGNALTSLATIDSNQTYHYFIEYYIGNTTETEKIEIPGSNLQHPQAHDYLEVKNNQVYIKQGAARLTHLETFIQTKDNNVTNTADNYYHPIYLADGVSPLTFHQGNNGLLKLEEPASLIIEKKVIVTKGFAPENKIFTFKLTVPSKKNLDVTAKVNGENTVLSFDSNGVTTFTLNDSQTIIIPNMTRSDYAIEETNLPTGYTSNYKDAGNKTSGRVELENAKVTYINTYKTEPITIDSAKLGFPQTKTIENREFKEGDYFEFELKSTTGQTPVSKTVTINPTSGYTANIDFGYFEFDKPGIYKYTLFEVNPTNTGSGLEPIPGISYSSETYVLTVHIIDDNGTLKLDSSINNGKGYTIELQKVGPEGETYELVDNANFVNTFNATNFTMGIFGIKQLVGRRLSELGHNFEFGIEAITDGAPMPTNEVAIADNAGGDFGFTGIKFEQANVGHTYEYMIYEQQPTVDGKYASNGLPGAVKNDNGQWVYQGITYDKSEKTVTIEVKQNAEGNIFVKTSLDTRTGKPTFVNSYATTPLTLDGEASVKVSKNFTGRPENAWLETDEFEFKIENLTGDSGDATFVGTSESYKTITIGKNTAQHELTFDGIQFSEPGEYKLKVSEIKPVNPIKGVDYSTKTATITVNVVDNLDGTLGATVSPQTVSFDNIYNTGDKVVLNGEYLPEVSKQIRGRSWQEGDQFTFKLEKLVNPNVKMKGNSTVTLKYDEIDAEHYKQVGNFENIEFTKPGSYTFTIRELGNDSNGLTYDKTAKQFTVKIEDNGEGELVVTNLDEISQTPINFVNTYEYQKLILEGNTSLSLQKNLNGREWTENDRFTFTIALKAGESNNVKMPSETKTVATIDNRNPGFARIEISEPGTYTFTITETSESGNGITIDSVPSKDLTIKVEDNGKGKLVVTEMNRVVFTNTYRSEPLVLENETAIKVSKTLNGRDWNESDEFEFELKLINGDRDSVSPLNATTSAKLDATNPSFEKISFNKTGTYTFEVKETKGEIAGVTYDETIYNVEVVVADNNKGQLVVDSINYFTVLNDEKTSVDGISFTNNYKASPVIFGGEGSTDLQVTKNFTGRPDDKWLSTDSFTFHLEPIGTYEPGSFTLGSTECTISAEDTVKAASFGAIKFFKPSPSRGYQFLITETHPGDGSEYRGISGVEYDESEKRVTVEVVDDGKGQLKANIVSKMTDPLVFNNVYAPSPFVGIPTQDPDEEGMIGIRLRKVLNGRPWNENDEFKFKIEPLDGAPATTNEIAVIKDTGDMFDFGILIISAEDMDGAQSKIFRYKISEIIPENRIPGVEYVTEPIVIKILITDDNEGALIAGDKTPNSGLVRNEATGENYYEFVNTYNPEVAKLGVKVSKNFTGRHDNKWLTSDKFKFQLFVDDETTNQAITDGKVELPENANGITIGASDVLKEKAFGNILFNEEGTYEFKVKEVKEDIPGVVYDEEVYTFTIVVEDNENGELVITNTIPDVFEFTNSYEFASPVTLDGASNLQVKKELSGRAWKDTDEFTFKLSPAGYKTKAAIENGLIEIAEGSDEVTVKANSKNYTASFGDIKFYDADTYTFEIVEVKPENPIKGVDYSALKQQITITTTDNNDGTLSAAVTPQTLTTFTNTYSVDDKVLEGAEYLDFAKKLVGRDSLVAENETFTFEISVDNDGPLPSQTTIVVGGSEKLTDGVAKVFNFGDITFTKDHVGKTFTYTISEVASEPQNEHLTYARPKTISVEVVDNGEGGMILNVEPGQDSNEFVNTYTPDPVILGNEVNEGISVTKNFSGRPNNAWLSTDEFKFAIRTSRDYGDVVVLPSDKTVTINGSSANHTATFNPITFKHDGVYTLVVSETKGTNASIIYDEKEVSFIVTVKDDDHGTLSIESVKVGEQSKRNATFNNTYSLTSTTLKFAEKGLLFTKEITGREWLEGEEFSFKLEPITNGAPMPASDTITITKDTLNHQATFGDIVYDSEDMVGATDENGVMTKTFKYKVTEQGESHDSLTYDKAERIISVVLTDANKGNLAVSATIEGSTTFENVYESSHIFSGITIQKTLEGRNMPAHAFTFELKAMDDATKAKLGGETITYTNVARSIDDELLDTAVRITALSDLKFTNNDAGKTFNFELREIVPEDQTVYTYDESVYAIKVAVADNGKGRIQTTMTVGKNGDEPDATTEINFVNKYENKPVTIGATGVAKINATKTFSNGELTENAFTFKVKDKLGAEVTTGTNDAQGNITFGDITYDNAKLRADIQSGAVTKSTQENGNIVYSYEYEVYEVTEGLDTQTITPIKSTFPITVKLTDKGTKDLTVEIVYPDDTNTLGFINSYSKGGIAIMGKKNLEVPVGAKLTLADLEGAFEFEIKGVEAIYDKIEETTDDAAKLNLEEEKPVTEGENDPTLLEQESDKDTLNLQTMKSPLSNAPTEGADETQVKQPEPTVQNDSALSSKPTEQKQDNANSETSNPVIKNEESANSKTEQPTVPTPETSNIEPTPTPTPTPTVDKVEEEVTEPVEESQATAPVVTEPLIIEPQIQLLLPLEPRNEGPKVPTTDPSFLAIPMPTNTKVRNGATGLVDFGTLTFDKDNFKNVKADENGTKTITYKYEVTEKPSGLDYIEDDSIKTKSFAIVVKMDKDNKITASLSDTNSGYAFEFTNTYKLSPKEDSLTGTGEGHLAVTKSLEGRAMNAQEFNFELVDTTSNTVVATGTNDANGNVVFTSITYSEPKTYSYIVREIGTDEYNGVTYDIKTYAVNAEVVDNKDGTMNVTWSSAEPIEFVNSYSTRPTSVTLSANKNLKGRTLEAEEFEFTLSDETGNIIETKTNDAAGGISFTELKFEAKGTYKYYVKEVAKSEKYMTYDDRIFEVIIEVKDNLKGYLVPEIQINVIDGEEIKTVEAIAFVNNYDKPEPKPVPTPTPIVIPNTATKTK